MERSPYDIKRGVEQILLCGSATSRGVELKY